MNERFLNFVKYNNAFTIILMMFFLGSGVSLAASPDLRGSVYSSTKSVVSVDNGALLSSNPDNYSFNLVINSVTEDGENYYVSYQYKTLSIVDYVWRDAFVSKSLVIDKKTLEGRDLGLYVSKELGDNLKYEVSYLKRVKEIEIKKGSSQKIVATQYAGLVGKLFDPKEEVIEGYNPIIPEEKKETQKEPEAKIAPDPSLFVENIPGYVKPDLNASTAVTVQGGNALDEDRVRRIIEEMLANSSSSGSGSGSSDSSDTSTDTDGSDNASTTPPATDEEGSPDTTEEVPPQTEEGGANNTEEVPPVEEQVAPAP